MKKILYAVLFLSCFSFPGVAETLDELDFSIGNWQQHMQIQPAKINRYRGFSIAKPEAGTWSISGPRQREQRAVWQIIADNAQAQSAVAVVDVSDVLSEEQVKEHDPDRLKMLTDRKIKLNSQKLVELKYESTIIKSQVEFRLTGVDNPEKGPALKVVILGRCALTKDGRIITIQSSARIPEPGNVDEKVLQCFIDSVKF